MVLGIGAFVYDPPRPEATRDEILAIDQMIPHGYQLVPIELQNGSAVNAVVDHFGVVDLYLGEERVAESLKLIRSAMSSEQFSVLIPDGSVGHLLGREGPFRASLRRREASPPWVRPLVKSHKALADWDVQALEPEKTP